MTSLLPVIRVIMTTPHSKTRATLISGRAACRNVLRTNELCRYEVRVPEPQGRLPVVDFQTPVDFHRV